MDILPLIRTVFIGLVLGSFATALSYRIPRDLSIVTLKRSRCPSCHKDLGAADLVPLLSWVFLRGKCRHCQARIGCRYPVIELVTLFLCLLFYSVYGLRPETFLIFALAPILVSIVDIDLHYKIIPDSLNLSILLTGFALLSVNAWAGGNPSVFFMDKGGDAVAGVFIYGAGAWLLRQAAMMAMKREPMGLGDVKFYAAAGFWIGLNPNAAALFMIVSGISGVVLALIWKKRTGEAEAPFGPSLIVAFISMLYFCVPDFIRL